MDVLKLAAESDLCRSPSSVQKARCDFLESDAGLVVPDRKAVKLCKRRGSAIFTWVEPLLTSDGITVPKMRFCRLLMMLEGSRSNTSSTHMYHLQR